MTNGIWSMLSGWLLLAVLLAVVVLAVFVIGLFRK